MTNPIFTYGQKEISYLQSKDKKLGEAIDRIGMIERTVIPDLFEALIHTIIGQQISLKAHVSIWERMRISLPTINPQIIIESSTDDLQKNGLSFRKVEYIQTIAKAIVTNELDLNLLHKMNDKEVCIELSKLKGIGIWSAEMLMLFSMQRPNVLSYGDLAIQRGLRMLYHHRTISEVNFKKYYRRYTPYASVASLYLWEIAGGAIPEMKDYAPQKNKK